MNKAKFYKIITFVIVVSTVLCFFTSAALADGDSGTGTGATGSDAITQTDGTPTDGTPTDGTPTDGTPTDGTPTDGTPTDGTPTDGTPTDGTPTDGTPTDGTPTDGTPTDGTPTDGTPTDGTPTDGTPTDGTPTDGTPTDGTPTDGTPTDGTPTDGTPTDGTPTDGTPTDPNAKYTLEFDVGADATGRPDAMTGNGPVYLPVSVPRKEGYEFLGWTKAGAEDEYYKAGSLFTLTGDTTLYAAWKLLPNPEVKYALTFDPNGGDYNTIPEKQIGIDVTIPGDKTPEREFYVFGGWATTNRAIEAQYQPGDSLTLTEDTTLYAFWVKDDTKTIVYTILFNPNGGINAPDKQVGSEGEINLTKAKPTKEGAEFLGWAETDNAKTAKYQPGDIIELKDDITLYAVWSTYTLTYNKNTTEKVSNLPGATTSAGKIKLSSNTPARSEYTFLGWAETSSATTATYKPGAEFTLTKDTVLYAVWQKKTPATNPDPVKYTIGIVDYTKTLDKVGYKSKLTFHATMDKKDVPTGYKIVWNVNGNDIKNENDSVYIIYQATAKEYKVQVKLVKTADEKAVAESDVETVQVRTNFFARLVAFFRELFKRLPEYVDNKKLDPKPLFSFFR